MTRGIVSWVLGLVVAGLATHARAEDAWMTSYAEALKAASKDKKAVLLDFTSSDASGDAAKLRDEVFATPDFTAWAKKNVVLLQVDASKAANLADDVMKQNEELRGKYDVDAIPTTVFVDGKGVEIGRSGYVAGGAPKWISAADAILALRANDDGWITNYERALKLAKKEKKVVLADFTGSDWCGWCIKLKEEVFSKPEFEEWAAKNVILLELDFPKQKTLPAELKKQNQELFQKNKAHIPGYPTIVFFDAKGKVLGALGYKAGGPAVWTRDAAKIIK